MNQAILFNDDFYYSSEYKNWVFTGMVSGEKVTIVICSTWNESYVPTQADKLDIEMIVEDWLEDNEPEDQLIEVNY